MLPTLTTDFRAIFPGPFAYERGVDGVDNTFDIYCLATNDRLASLYYWDARLISEFKTHIITATLNHLWLEGHDDRSPRFQEVHKWITFQAMFPGPYRIAPIECEMYGPGHEVCGADSENFIIACCDYGKDTAVIAQQIADALNALASRA